MKNPSAADIYHLVTGYLGNSNYTTDYVIDSNGKQYALVIDDPSKVATFNQNFPSSTFLGADNSFAHMEDEEETEGINSLGEHFNSLVNNFYSMGYNKNDVYNQALSTMLKQYDTGIKFMEKTSEDDSFKGLNIKIEKDANGKVSNVKLTKCK